MEYLGWECSANVTSWWSNDQQYCDHQTGELSSNLILYGYTKTTEDDDDIFNTISSVVDVDKYPTDDSEKILASQILVSPHQDSAPPMNSVIVASSAINGLENEQQQHQILEAYLCNSDDSPYAINNKVVMPSFDNIMPQYVTPAPQQLSPTTTASTTNCFLSGTSTNSNTNNYTTTSPHHLDDSISSILFPAAHQYHYKNSCISSEDQYMMTNERNNQNSTIRHNSSSSSCAKRSYTSGTHFSGQHTQISQLISRNNHDDDDHHPLLPQAKKARILSTSENSYKPWPSSSNINFQQPSSNNNNSSSSQHDHHEEPDAEAIAQMKEMIYRAAAFRPVNLLEDEVVEKPKRRNVKISCDPQTVAARQRRERISDKIRILQKLVPGGTKMDTASMLDEAANYLKFLRSQVKALEALGTTSTQGQIINNSFAM